MSRLIPDLDQYYLGLIDQILSIWWKWRSFVIRRKLVVEREQRSDFSIGSSDRYQHTILASPIGVAEPMKNLPLRLNTETALFSDKK